MQGFGELDEIYRDTILDHYRKPRNTAALENPEADVQVNNPFCGDEIHLQLSTNGDVLSGVRVSGRGCAISQSSGSLMSESVVGKSIADVHELSRLFRGLMTGDALSEEGEERLADLLAFEGVRRYPVRIKCALLSWSGLSEALRALKGEGPTPTSDSGVVTDTNDL